MQGLSVVPVEGRNGQLNPGVVRVPKQELVNWSLQQARTKHRSALLHSLTVRSFLLVGATSTAAVAWLVVPKIMQHA